MISEDSARLGTPANGRLLDERSFAGRVAEGVPRPVELYGLVLAGGRSRRMGRDKSALNYRGEPHARYTADLLSPYCERVFYSCRADQADNPLFADHPKIADVFPDQGPLGGILSAFAAHPDAAFLVLACDLPFLDAETLKNLIRGREPRKIATAFFNPERGKPEPLCAIYEPAYAIEAGKFSGQGVNCPTKILEQSDVHLIPLSSARLLENANHPEDYELARAKLNVTVEYFAVFRACAGRNSEDVEIGDAKPSAVFERLRSRYRFPMDQSHVHLAVNDEFAPWDRPLSPGDRVAFLPPVSGG